MGMPESPDLSNSCLLKKMELSSQSLLGKISRDGEE